MSYRFPPPLRPGSTIAVVAPAGPLPRKELFAGLAWLGLRYRLRMFSGALSRSGYLAGSDERRADELTWALSAPGIDAVMAGRGGYGAMRVLERVDLTAMTQTPRWLIGFSDVTALHVALSSLGLASIHSCNVTGFGGTPGVGGGEPRERAAFLRTLERPTAPFRWEGLRTLTPGQARGPVFGGNLALLEAMAAAGRLRVPAGAILMLEDVTERPYRIDRMLTSLALGGHFARVAAVVLGGFDHCEPGPDGVTVAEVLRERCSRLGVPVACDAPFGHGSRNEPFTIGRIATLADGTLTFE